MPMICMGMVDGQISIIPVEKTTTYMYIVIFEGGGGGAQGRGYYITHSTGQCSSSFA